MTAALRVLFSTRWMACGCVMVVATLPYLLLPPEVGNSIYNPMGAAAAVAVITGAGCVASTGTWRWIGVALLAYAMADTFGSMSAINELTMPLAAASALYLFSYIALAVGLAGVAMAALVNKKKAPVPRGRLRYLGSPLASERNERD